MQLLKKHKLDVPQATELVFQLKAMGCNLPDGILNEEECAAALELLLGKPG